MSALPTPKPPQPPLGPLENGDRLSRAEFERRYQRMPASIKAELIDGIVHMPSPVRHVPHGRPHAFLSAWLVTYAAMTPGCDPGDNSTVRLSDTSEVQPDLLLRLPEKAGGRSRIEEDLYIAGAPELVCEITASSVSIDLHAKLNSYCQSRVPEYLVWRTQDAAIDWYILRENNYELLQRGSDGLLKSRIFPGLWLNADALLAGDLRTVLQTLNAGLASPEHAAFLSRLGD